MKEYIYLLLGGITTVFRSGDRISFEQQQNNKTVKTNQKSSKHKLTNTYHFNFPVESQESQESQKSLIPG